MKAKVIETQIYTVINDKHGKANSEIHYRCDLYQTVLYQTCWVPTIYHECLTERPSTNPDIEHCYGVEKTEGESWTRR